MGALVSIFSHPLSILSAQVRADLVLCSHMIQPLGLRLIPQAGWTQSCRSCTERRGLAQGVRWMQHPAGTALHTGHTMFDPAAISGENPGCMPGAARTNSTAGLMLHSTESVGDVCCKWHPARSALHTGSRVGLDSCSSFILIETGTFWTISFSKI